MVCGFVLVTGNEGCVTAVVIFSTIGVEKCWTVVAVVWTVGVETGWTVDEAVGNGICWTASLAANE